MANIVNRYATLSYPTNSTPEIANLFISYDEDTNELTVKHNGGIQPLTTDVFATIARFLMALPEDETMLLSCSNVVCPFDRCYRFTYDCGRNAYGYELASIDGCDPEQYHILSETEDHRFWGSITRPAPVIYQLLVAIGALQVLEPQYHLGKLKPKASIMLRRPRDLTSEPGWTDPRRPVPRLIAAINEG